MLSINEITLNNTLNRMSTNTKALLSALAKLIESQNQIFENNNQIKFTTTFTGKGHETLPWIFAAEKYLRVNDIKTPKIQFRQIFQSMHTIYQNRFLMETDNEDDNMTFDRLKTWVLKEYPPPKTKYEFKTKLKQLRMKKDEDPNIAYARFKYKLAQITKAIKTINLGLRAEARSRYPAAEQADQRASHYNSIKISGISIEDQLEALKLMFVHRNNKPQYNNEGKINELVFKRFFKGDPKTLDDWDEEFKKMKYDLIPRIMDGHRDYEYITYPVDADEDNIYTKKRHLPDSSQPSKQPRPDFNDPRSSKKRRRESDNSDNQPQGKRRKKNCQRCHRSGHVAKYCRATVDVNGRQISF